VQRSREQWSINTTRAIPWTFTRRLAGTAICFIIVTLADSAAAQRAVSNATNKGWELKPYSPHANVPHATRVFFGDTHVHTSLSADAGGAGTRLLPRDSYRLARGEQVVSNSGQPVKLSRPLDFYMITDHSDGMGLIQDIVAGAPHIMADPLWAGTSTGTSRRAVSRPCVQLKG